VDDSFTEASTIAYAITTAIVVLCVAALVVTSVNG
jgi:hypothetical protein